MREMHAMNDEKPVTGYFLNLTDDERHEFISGVLSNIDFSKARRLEHAAKSKLVTDFVQFLTTFSLERVLRGLILKTVEDGLQRCDLDRDDARFLKEGRDEFLSSFDTIASWSNPEHRQVALTAVLSTLVIARHGQVQDLIQGLHRDFTKHANEARRALSIQEIIERRARDLWGKKSSSSSFKSNDLGTANKIYDDVTADLRELQKRPKKVPPTWRPLENPTGDDKNKAINRIAGRLKRIERSDR
jgi:hypothetical protein